MPPRAMVVLCLLVACGGPTQGPFFDDHRHLVFGVDRDAEASTVVERFEAAGRRVLLRLRGRHFTALGFDDGSGRPSAVRVITARGIAMALDPPPASGLHDPIAHRLLAAPIEGTQDADGDGFEELFVERLEGGAREGCIEVYRVRDTGFVDPVAIELDDLAGGGCIEDLRDLEPDGRVEPWLVLRRGLVDAATGLSVGIPLRAEAHRFVVRPADPAVVAALATQRSVRELSLADAQAEGDAESVYRLALELALIARLEGVPADDRASALEAALAGVPVDPVRVSAALAQLRAERAPVKAGK